jgi:hypothetical protein
MINLTEILERHSNSYRIHGNDANIIPECAIDAMREAIKQALELAANEVECTPYREAILNLINKVV